MGKETKMTPKEAEELARKIIEHGREYNIPMKKRKKPKK